MSRKIPIQPPKSESWTFNTRERIVNLVGQIIVPLIRRWGKISDRGAPKDFTLSRAWGGKKKPRQPAPGL